MYVYLYMCEEYTYIYPQCVCVFACIEMNVFTYMIHLIKCETIAHHMPVIKITSVLRKPPQAIVNTNI